MLDWIAANPERRQHTLLIIAADHETGGFAIKGTDVPGGEISGSFTPAWVFQLDALNPIANHTGGDVLIWSQGPGSEALNRAMENTWVYAVVTSVLK